MLTTYTAALGETCPGAAAGGGCAQWCKTEKQKNHCKHCKCSGCGFCSEASPRRTGAAVTSAQMAESAPRPSRSSRRYAQNGAAAPSCSPREGSVPFVMWMPGRTGSTWVQEALNSHPEVTMLGEVFNNGTTGEGFARGMCKFYGAPVGRRVRRVRGFKQKFFQCNADLHDKLCAFQRQPLAMGALDSCLRPATAPPPPGMAPDAGWNVSSRSYSVYTAVGTRVVCSLRRSSLDRALSKAVQLALFKKCGVSNAVTEAERACLGRLQQERVSVSVPYVLQVMREAEMAAAYNAAVCEAQARFSPVFFLWYEDLLAHPERLFGELQRFLGVEPRQLKSSAQRIVSKGAASWIANLAEVEAAATKLDRRAGDPKCAPPAGR